MYNAKCLSAWIGIDYLLWTFLLASCQNKAHLGFRVSPSLCASSSNATWHWDHASWFPRYCRCPMGTADVTYPKLCVPLSQRSLQPPSALPLQALIAHGRNLPDTPQLPTRRWIAQWGRTRRSTTKGYFSLRGPKPKPYCSDLLYRCSDAYNFYMYYCKVHLGS